MTVCLSGSGRVVWARRLSGWGGWEGRDDRVVDEVEDWVREEWVNPHGGRMEVGAPGEGRVDARTTWEYLWRRGGGEEDEEDEMVEVTE